MTEPEADPQEQHHRNGARDRASTLAVAILRISASLDLGIVVQKIIEGANGPIVSEPWDLAPPTTCSERRSLQDVGPDGLRGGEPLISRSRERRDVMITCSLKLDRSKREDSRIRVHGPGGEEAMRRSKFSEQLIAFILHQAKEGTRVEEVYRRAGSRMPVQWRRQPLGLGLAPRTGSGISTSGASRSPTSSTSTRPAGRPRLETAGSKAARTLNSPRHQAGIEVI